MAPNSLPTAQVLRSDEKNWAMICHLSSLLGFVLVPSANLWAPLVIWLVARNISAFVDYNGKEAVNFHLSLWIYVLASGVIALVLSFTLILIPIVLPLFLLVLGGAYISGVVCSIIAAVKAANGEIYRYPFTLRLIS